MSIADGIEGLDRGILLASTSFAASLDLISFFSSPGKMFKSSFDF